LAASTFTRTASAAATTSGRRLDVVGLGFSSVDYLGIVPRLPTIDEGAPLLDFTQQGGGPVAQALVALARLGAATGFVGRLGDDEAGQFMRRGLLEEGIDISHLQIQRNATSPQCIILVHQPTGKRSICCTGGTAGPVADDSVDVDYVSSGRYLHLDGHSRPAAIRAARAACERGVKVCLDVGSPGEHVAELIDVSDIVVAGVRCAESFALDGHDYRAGAEAMLERGPEIVVVTLGEHGSYTKTRDQEFTCPSFRVPVVDTTGAGDVFHGGYIYGLLRGWDLFTVAEFASACSALKCGKLGGRAGIPTLAAVESFLVSQGRPLPR